MIATPALQLEIDFIEPFNKSSSYLLYCRVILQLVCACSFKMGFISFCSPPLRHLCTSISYNRRLQYIVSMCLLKMKCPLWLQFYLHLILSVVYSCIISLHSVFVQGIEHWTLPLYSLYVMNSWFKYLYYITKR